jgi:hypothetical protein
MQNYIFSTFQRQKLNEKGEIFCDIIITRNDKGQKRAQI